MRIVFMGTPEFAVPSLEALVRAHRVVGVYTRPDAVSGRGSTRRPSPVKQAAAGQGLTVFQPTTLRDASAVAELRALAPELIVVAAYGMILPPEVLTVPERGCVNVHASLLPRWRGAAPIQRAILAGDEQTGVSIMRMEEGLDTGPFCQVARVAVADKTASELTRELAQAGARALVEALGDLESGECRWVEQDDEDATYAGKITKSDVALSPGLTVAAALRRVRASSAQAPARASVADRPVTVTALRAADTEVGQGRVRADRTGFMIGLADGAVEVVGIKPDGKQEMSGADWARGLRLEGDGRWKDVQ